MDKPADGGFAFPLVVSDDLGIRYETGMSLRDYFAGQALAGIVAHPGDEYDEDNLATFAYELADAMLKARNAK